MMMPIEAPSAYYTPTEFRHDIYINNSVGKLIVQNCILGPAANAGIQSRVLNGPSIISGNIFLDLGTALLLIEGGATVTGNIIYDSHLYFDGSNGAGGSAIKSYWPVLCQDNIIVAASTQSTFPAFPNHPTARMFPAAMIDLGGAWQHTNPSWTQPPGYPNIPQYMSGAGNQFPASWSGSQNVELPGWALAPRQVDFDYVPVLAAIEAGGSVAAGITALKAGLRLV
jgi:hypothetical protein